MRPKSKDRWHSRLGRLSLGSALLLAFPMRGAAQNDGPPEIKTIVEMGSVDRPCHLLRNHLSYVFPDYVVMGSDDRHMPGMPVNGIRYDKGGWTNNHGPIGMQSIELQRYKPGMKIIIVPWGDRDDGNRIKAWAVFRVFPESRILGYYDSNTGQPETDNNYRPITHNVVADKKERAAMLRARWREDFWVLSSWRSLGFQTPYLQEIYTRDGLIESAPGVKEYHHGYNTRLFIQETCRLSRVLTVEEINTLILPGEVRDGYQRCSSEDYTDPTTEPQCLANFYLSGQRAQDSFDRMTATLGIFPIIGTTIKISECLDTGSAYCWGEAAVSGAADVAEIVVPFSRLGRAATVAKTLTRTEKAFVGIAAAGQSALGTIDLFQGREMQAVARFVGAGLFVYSFKPVTTPNGNLSTYKRLQDSPPSTPICIKPETVAAPLCKRPTIVEPANTLTKDQFAKAVDDARAVRPDKFSPVQEVDTVYRVDSRGPDEIERLGGHFPNPNKPDGTIIDHTALGQSGTSRYVSTTVQEANPTVVLGSDFPKVQDNWLDESEILEVVNKKWPDGTPLPEPIRYHVYEYRAHKVEVTVLTATTYADEQEAVVRALRTDHPSGMYVRRVEIEVPWVIHKSYGWEPGDKIWIQPGDMKTKGVVSKGEWKQLDPAKCGGGAKPLDEVVELVPKN